MGSERLSIILGELVKKGGGFIQTGPFGSQLHAADYVESGIPCIMPVNIIDNKVSLNEICFISENDAQRLSKHIVKAGDIVYSRRGDVTRKALIRETEAGMFCGTGCLLIRAGSAVDAQFLTYHLSTPENQEWIIRHAIGATMPNLNTSILSNIPLSIPSIEEQKAIAHILGSFDDKIELNRQMSATLEAMAQALFKSWFVDFDPVLDNALAAGNPIPDELQSKAAARLALGDARKPLPADIQALFPSSFVLTEEMGWIPEGWEVKEIGLILKRLNIKKRYSKIDVQEYGSIPVYEQGTNLLLGYHRSEADITCSLEEPAFIFGDHTCVTKISIESFSISQNVIALRGKDLNTGWVYYAVKDKQSFEEYRRHWMELIAKTVLTPKFNDLPELFYDQIKPYLERQTLLAWENSTLQQLRDTLLPKLLSGELRIPE